MKTLKYVPPKPDDFTEQIIQAGYEPDRPDAFLVDVLFDDGEKERILVHVTSHSLWAHCYGCGVQVHKWYTPPFSDDDVMRLVQELQEHYKECYMTSENLEQLRRLAYRIAQNSDSDLALIEFYLAEVLRKGGAQ
jgi:hypothetical protein